MLARHSSPGPEIEVKNGSSEPIQVSSFINRMSRTWRFTCRHPGGLLLLWPLVQRHLQEQRELLQVQEPQFSVSFQSLWGKSNVTQAHTITCVQLLSCKRWLCLALLMKPHRKEQLKELPRTRGMEGKLKNIGLGTPRISFFCTRCKV